LARRLRHDRVRGRVVVLKWKLTERLGPGRFRLVTRRTTLAAPTDDGKAIADAALALWTRHRPAGAIRLVGVAAAGIVGGGDPQGALFEDPERRRRAALNTALDRIVAQYGEDSVARGGVRVDKGLTGHVKRGT
jgi:DNA polymerase-4